MNTAIRFGISTLFFALIGVYPTLVHAQQTIPLVPILEDSIESTVSPSIPGTFERVTIDIKNYSGDFTRATIQWFIDGVLVSEGVGETKFTFTTGGVGETVTIRMKATSHTGKVNERTYTFTPSEIDLIWETDTYTPATYKGKALHTIESPLRIVAFPTFKKNGITYNPNQLIYTWSINGKVRNDLSGYNKQVIDLRAEDTYRSQTQVTVRIATTDNSVISEKSTTIQTIDPFIVLYEHMPLIGPNYASAISKTYKLQKQEIRLIAEPYFFDVPSSTHPLLSYSWKINQTPVSFTDTLPNILTLRHTGGSGKSTLSLSTTHGLISEQNQNQSITIEFTEN